MKTEGGINLERVWHLAAFFASLPSKGQEIDEKLPYDSR
jgi:hypothetical protein